jgi:hypothetical protein
MIIFDLKCLCGCQFEGWFVSRADFERQNSVDQIACPRCGSGEIHKILSPVAIHANPSQAQTPAQASENNDITPEMAIKFLRSVQDFVEKNFEDVGPKLAQESLKILYGAIEPRNIRGVATADEEKMLREEGIELLKIPMVKKSSDPNLN